MLSHSSKYMQDSQSHSEDSSDHEKRTLVSSSRRSKKKKGKYTKKKAKKPKIHHKHKSRKSSSESDSSDSSSDESDSDSSESSSSSDDSDDYSEESNKESKKKKAKNFAKQKKLEKAKKKMLVEYEKRILDEMSVNAVTEYMKIKVDTFLKKRQFFNGPAENTEMSVADLKRIIVTIERSMPPDADPMEVDNGKVKCEFETLDDLTVPRAPDEGKKCIFDREDIKAFMAQAAILKENRAIPRFLLKPSKVRIKRRHESESPSGRGKSPTGQQRFKKRYLAEQSVQSKFKKRLPRDSDSSPTSDRSPVRSDAGYSGGYYSEKDKMQDSDKDYGSDHSIYNTEGEEYRSNSVYSSAGSAYEDSNEEYDEQSNGRYYRRNNNNFRQQRGRGMRFMNRGRPQRFRGRGFPRPMLMRPGMQRPFLRGRRPMGRFRPPYRPPRYMGPPNMHRNYSNRYDNSNSNNSNEFSNTD